MMNRPKRLYVKQLILALSLALLVWAGRAPADTISVTSADQYLNSTVNVTAADTVSFTNGITTFRFGGLTGDGAIPLANLDASCITLQVGGSGPNTTFSGTLSGCGGLTKAGANTLTLANTNRYTGPTIVNAGTLRLLPPLPAVTGTLGLWLDATRLSLADGASVSTWPDVSGNNRNATGGTSPSYVAANRAFNNLPTVNFNGSSQYLNVDLTFLAGSAYTIFAVLAKNASRGFPNSMYFLGNSTGGQGPNNAILQCGWRNDNQFRLGQYGNDIDCDVPPYTGSEVACLFGGKLDTSSGHCIYYNDALGNSVGNTTPLGSSNSGTIGKVTFYNATYGTMNNWFIGDIGEILVYRSALSDADRQKVDACLNAKWGLGIANLPAISSNLLPAVTSVLMAPGGIMDIGSSTNMVRALYFNGSPQAGGTWGSSASAADHKNDVCFAGRGVLLVAPPPSKAATLIVR